MSIHYIRYTTEDGMTWLEAFKDDPLVEELTEEEFYDELLPEERELLSQHWEDPECSFCAFPRFFNADLDDLVEELDDERPNG